MHDVMVQLMRYARATWQYRWWMLGIAWAVCLVGWIIVARMPDQYQASARVYVDTQSVLAPFLRGLTISVDDTDRKVLLMTRTLLSQPNLEKVLRMTDLDLQAKTAGDREALIQNLRDKISLRGTRQENLYTIAYTDDSPEVAKLVVKSLVTLFMEGNLGEARKDQDSATQFLEQQIDDYARRMREMEADITRFKQANLGYLPDETGGYYERIRNLKAQQERAALDLKVAQDRAAALKAQIGGEQPTFGLGPQVRDEDVDTRELDARISSVENRLDELLFRFTDKHPDVVSARAKLKDLRAERQREIAAARREMARSPELAIANESPYMQQLRLALAEADAEIAAKKVLVQEYDTRAKDLTEGIEKVLRVEAEQQQRSRDYAVLKKNHDALASRLEAAKLGRRADTSTDTVQFKIIDPPIVPSKPSGPNRVLFSTIVLFAGLAVGLAVAFVMSQLRPTFDERQLMNDVLGLPVLGSVNMVWTRDQVKARRARNLSFVFSLTGLIVIFGGVLALYQFDINLLPRLAQSLEIS